MQEATGMPMELKRLINADSLNPIPLKLMGIIVIRVITGTKIMNMDKGA